MLLTDIIKGDDPKWSFLREQIAARAEYYSTPPPHPLIREFAEIPQDWRTILKQVVTHVREQGFKGRLYLRGSRIEGYWAESEERMALAKKAGKHYRIYKSDWDICTDKDEESFRKTLRGFKIGEERFDPVYYAPGAVPLDELE